MEVISQTSNEQANILLVDDHPNNLLALEAMLESLGQNVVTACSGSEALEKLANEDFAVILLDVQMPGLDGFETAVKIKEQLRARHTPIIFITAIYKTNLHISRGYSLGAVDYMFKPVDPDVLKAKVAALVDAHLEAERKRAQERQQLMEQLEAERNLLKAVLQQMPIGVVIAEAPSGKLIFNNDQAEKILGNRTGQPENNKLNDQPTGRHADGRPYRSDDWPMTRALKGDRVTAEEIHFSQSNQSRLIVSANAAPIRTNGHISAGVVTFVDITAQKRREKLLAGQRHLLELIAKAVPLTDVLNALCQLIEEQYPQICCAVMELTVDGQHLKPAAAPALPSDIIQAITRLPFGPDAGDKGLAASLNIIVTRDLCSDPFWQARQELVERHQLRAWWAAPIHSSHGQLLGALLIFHRHSVQPQVEEIALIQITTNIAGIAMERALIEEDRVELFNREKIARNQAERASRIKDDFLATVSHELRTPLTAILGWSRLLRSNRLDESARERATEAIERNAKMQAQLVDDVLDISRIITGKLRLDIRPVDLAEIIENAAENIHLSAIAKDIEIKLDIGAEVGPISGNANRLQQIIFNLLSNAVKFTPQNGQIEIRLARLNSKVQLVIRDTGKGISPEVLPFIYDYFYQGDSSTTRAYGGLGLGLAIVRHLVELHGGTIEAESPGEGLGTTFTVKFPVPGLLYPASPPQEKAGPINPLIETASLQDLKILVVEDDYDTREMLRLVLEQRNALVRTASTAKEGFRELVGWKPDLIVSDIGLPGENGYDFIRKVRGLSSDEGGLTMAIALTAFASAEDRRRSLIAGFQSHIAKPVEPGELVLEAASLTGRIKPN